MTVVPQSQASVSRGGSTGSLYDILELILDRGLVIDVFIRVSLVGIEILKIDIRIVVASVDTYLRFAEACNRLDLEAGRKAPTQLTDIVGEVTEGGARGKSKGALSGAMEAVSDTLHGGRDRDDEEKEPAPKRPARRPTRRREE
ncbi:gas vesicle structural protein GvpA [Streptacidiphilus jiangxiensis]|uniref:Gas vesicle protein A n=1 Tax=Streptacidiphilus jiangxiensis TaxID=235985 RepID=A0A1H7NTC3_STRJI|nr:gas vesicle structural protein GvpA [Streptacidiphilus jiangxiensis]SEL26793.1 Gas vesicle protein [Streptacidiphilus jiangxiensis]